jgi:hypothetical protein
MIETAFIVSYNTALLWQRKPYFNEDSMSRKAIAGTGVAGCEAARGPTSSGGQNAPKPSRDIDQQVDAVIKDFKNE